MAVTISTPPTLPSLSDPATFDTRAAAFFSWLVNEFVADLEGITADDIFTALGGHLLPDADAVYDLGSATHKFRNIYAESISGGFLGSKVTRLTTGTSATFNLQSGTRRFRIRQAGGGAAGGGASSSTTSSSGGAGGGGGGGAYCEFLVDAYELGISSFTYTIGNKGFGNAGTAGGNANDTVYSDGTNTMTSGGGLGGTATTFKSNVNYAIGGVGGTNSQTIVSNLSVLYQARGVAGRSGLIFPPAGVTAGKFSLGGEGGTTPFGAGGRETAVGSDDTGSDGASASDDNSGAGGGGACALGSAGGPYAGGDGSKGFMIVEEYPY